MENKKLSVIIIGNNNIENCLQNLSNQSYQKNMEIVVLSKKREK